MKNLYIVALFQFKESDIMDALELLKKLVFATRAEEGCFYCRTLGDRRASSQTYWNRPFDGFQKCNSIDVRKICRSLQRL